MRTNPDQFRDVWNSSSSVQEAADRLGIVYGAAASRATRLRNAGVDIKRMTPPGRNPVRYSNAHLQSAIARNYRGRTTEGRFWSQVDRRGPDECWIWRGSVSPPTHTGFQYGRFGLTVNGRSVLFRAHRLAWAISRRADPRGKVILHTCDTPLCVNPSHLRAGTSADNNADRGRKGRTAVGRKLPHTKLSADLVRKIRRSRRSDQEWADELGVHYTTIMKARTGENWSHVK